MTPFRAMVIEAAALANQAAALESLADELEELIASEHFAHYQHQRLTAMAWALRLMGEAGG